MGIVEITWATSWSTSWPSGPTTVTEVAIPSVTLMATTRVLMATVPPAASTSC